VRSEVGEKNSLVFVESEILNDSDEVARGHIVSWILDSSAKRVSAIQREPFEIAAWEKLKVMNKALLEKPALWSIEEPNLYRLITELEVNGKIVDHDDTSFGVRTIRFDPDHGLFLNGKQVKIKGTCSHQDYAGVGIGMPDRLHYDRVLTMKEMGSNGWRTAHNTVAPEFLDVCDRLGMMVMCEARMMSSSPEGLSELERMIRRDRNHPSIIIWSLANEEHYQGTEQGAAIVSNMKRLCKKLDPTRPVTAAMNGGWGKGLSGVVEVQGFNYWNGGTPGDPASPTNIDAIHQQFPTLPMVGTEVSTGKQTRGIYHDDPSRGYVTAFEEGCVSCTTPAEKWWGTYYDRPFLSGGFTWVGFDYRGEPKPYDHISISSQSGIFDTCGFPKDIYFYYKSWWGDKPVLHLFPHWNWAGKENQNIEVRCYSNLDYVELRLNGINLGSKPVIRNSHLTWSVKYQPGTIEARGFKNGQLAITERRETTGQPAKLVLRPNRNTIAADGEDIASVTVEVHDSQGRIVPTAENKIQFKLRGDGKIIGVGNGDPSCHEADKPHLSAMAERSNFNGLCLALIQATKEAGTIYLEASAEGLESANTLIRNEVAKVRPSAG
jgi:beta-galactosidase